MWSFEYSATLTKAKEGGYTVTFRDVPEAITQGEDVEDALHEAADCLEEAFAARMRQGLDLPRPSRARARERRVALAAPMAAKAALYSAMRRSGITKVELARRLRCDEKEVRRLLDPRHPSKLPRLTEALHALGKRLVMEMRNAA